MYTDRRFFDKLVKSQIEYVVVANGQKLKVEANYVAYKV